MSAKKHVLGSDLARVDAHAITPAEYDELPELTELTEADLGRGVWMDPDVLAWYRAWALVRSRIEAMINLRDPLAVLAS